MASTPSIRACSPSSIEDEIVALTFQMEECRVFDTQDKGKYPVDRPPDLEVAIRSFREMLQGYKSYLDDRKLARSIGCAVHQDGAIIAALNREEVQGQEDRDLALRLCESDGNLQTLLPAADTDLRSSKRNRSSTAQSVVTTSADWPLDDEEEDEAGPSMTFAERQADLLQKMSALFTCGICLERHHRATVVATQREHRYCTACAKDLFVRATRDEALFPPRCCKQPMALESVSKSMSAEELQAFKDASVEFTTINRVYCSNRQCGVFLPPTSIDVSTNSAICDVCAARTCCLCKGEYHKASDCPDDPDLRQTRELARASGWQTCPGCNVLVQLRTGCNHMICRCRAEFCYVCGVRWKHCKCAMADERRMYERAAEVVDRDAEPDLPRGEWDRRVRRVHAELDNNHECEHPGRFQRLYGGGRRGFQCELCDDRHRKYILQCRHCFLNVCEDCRRNRI